MGCPDKSSTLESAGPFADHSLGAAGVGNQCVRLEYVERGKNLGDRLREIHQVRCCGRFGQRLGFINRAARQSFLDGLRGADADDLSLKSGLP
jgi:hypothetical protein